MEDNRLVIHGPEPHEPLSPDTLGKIFFESLMSNKTDDCVMIDAHTGKNLTSGKLLEESCYLAEAIRTYGCTTNTTLAISSENNLQFFVPIIGSFFVGTIMVPVSQSYTTDELNHVLSITQPKIIFSSKKTLPKFLIMKEKITSIEKIIVIDTEKHFEGAETIREFIINQLNGKIVIPSNFRPFEGDPAQHTAIILCSSGTTGLPKGVMLSHSNLSTRLLQSRDPRYLSKYKTVLGLMPFYHSYGLIFGLTSIFNRELTIMIDRFDEDSFLEAIQKYRISVLRITPPLAIFLAKTPKLLKYDLSCAKEIFCAAAPLSGQTEIDLKRRLNLKGICQAYGCTEGTLALTIMNKNVYRPGSCGQVITYMICKVRDPESGRSLGPSEIGELCFKGPTVMQGYYKNKEAAEESFTSDGWLRTGDLGYYDEEGYFYIVDRLKELIKYKGYQVPPAELEAILVSHPKVLEAGVVGLPNAVAGELPLGFVVKRGGADNDVTEKELQDYVASKVSSPKKLRGGVIFVPSIPKVASGKILRKELKLKLNNYIKQQSKL